MHNIDSQGFRVVLVFGSREFLNLTLDPIPFKAAQCEIETLVYYIFYWATVSRTLNCNNMYTRTYISARTYGT